MGIQYWSKAIDGKAIIMGSDSCRIAILNAYLHFKAYLTALIV